MSSQFCFVSLSLRSKANLGIYGCITLWKDSQVFRCRYDMWTDGYIRLILQMRGQPGQWMQKKGVLGYILDRKLCKEHIGFNAHTFRIGTNKNYENNSFDQI